MIYISLENERINILDRRKIYYSLPLIMPLIFKINRIVKFLNREQNVDCNVCVRVGNIINLEVRNDG